jgi:hypothetical protein
MGPPRESGYDDAEFDQAITARQSPLVNRIEGTSRKSVPRQEMGRQSDGVRGLVGLFPLPGPLLRRRPGKRRTML